MAQKGPGMISVLDKEGSFIAVYVVSVYYLVFSTYLKPGFNLVRLDLLALVGFFFFLSLSY